MPSSEPEKMSEEIPPGTTAANNFISTLSESLQLSSVKCLDFDSEIEIQGYIHLSIDKGNPLSFVLDEQILRQSLAITCVSKTALEKLHLKQEHFDFTTIDSQNNYPLDESKDQEKHLQISQSAIDDQGLMDTSADCDDDSLTLDGPKLSSHCDDVQRKYSFSQQSEADQGKYFHILCNKCVI